MNIVLTPELKALVERKVASGLYKSASEVIREALRLLEERERIKEERLAALRAEIAKGIEDFEQGRYQTIEGPSFVDQIKAEGREYLASMPKNS